MSEAYGPNYDLDDNIGHSYVRFGANEMIVSVDRTSGTNASRLIFEKRRNGNWCVILASPPTASLVPSTQKTASSRPLQWTSLTQAAAGYSETKVVYLWDEHKSIYFPINCFHINKKSVKKIDCENAYSE
ncbi:hypothetical protein ACAX43_02555 [Paraburkholderia sp. IW21]|uniref:hypothetical protein n=1 Tax=Paraburkholderia sp. IW21 TaxID=3242488 RepID=UPI00351FACB2